MENAHVLVVDDYNDFRELVAFVLTNEGYRVTEAATGKDALEAIRLASPDLIILDIGLPDIDGVEVCREARKTTDVPILMLTGELSAGVAAKTLDVGATDYIRKPVELVELAARVRAALRRSEKAETPADVVEVGRLRVDTLREEATFNGKDIGLSGTEIRVLAHFIHRKGEVVSKDDVIRELWGGDREPHLVEVHVSSIRRKLGKCDVPADMLRTVRALGYRFMPPDEA